MIIMHFISLTVDIGSGGGDGALGHELLARLLRVVEAEHVVLAEDHPRPRLQDDRAVDLSPVHETYRSVLRQRRIQD